MNKIKKKLICLTLCMALVLGTASTALASSGSATYGGATVKWSMTSSESTNTVSYKATAKLRFVGSLYVKNNISGVKGTADFDTGNVTRSSYTLSATPGFFSSFISSGSNSMKVYINNSCFITYHPQP